MKRRKRLTKIDNKGKKRLFVYLSICFFIFLYLIIRIGYLQFIKGSELKEQAVKNQLSSKTIVPSNIQMEQK